MDFVLKCPVILFPLYNKNFSVGRDQLQQTLSSVTAGQTATHSLLKSTSSGDVSR